MMTDSTNSAWIATLVRGSVLTNKRLIRVGYRLNRVGSTLGCKVRPDLLLFAESLPEMIRQRRSAVTQLAASGFLSALLSRDSRTRFQAGAFQRRPTGCRSNS